MGQRSTLSRRTFRRKRGSVLFEAMLSMSILTVLGLVLLKMSLNILHPRQWALQQSLTDAYLTYEVAYAQRIPFDELTSNTSPWPIFTAGTAPASTQVQVGTLPGGQVVNATLTRIRIADTNNYPIDGGSGDTTTNPAAMKVWEVQSILSYQIGGRQYLKSRTVLRAQ